jgi:L-malate glycosyltransferase
MKIVIFQPMLKFYRVPMFEQLHSKLVANGHEIRIVFGTPWKEEAQRGDNVVVQNNYCFFEKSHWFFNNKIHFMGAAIKHILWADFVITEQANKHIHNYILVLLSFLKMKPFAYWGHGENRQGDSKSFKEIFKKMLAIRTDWWFAYTEGVANYLIDLGFNKDTITILNNSVDTNAFRQSVESLNHSEISLFKHQYNLADNTDIGLFCGSLYKGKQIEFLMEAAIIIKRQHPNFVLLIGGSGQDKNLVETYSANYDFIIYLGTLHGKAKSLAFRCSSLFLCPGPLGLAILDAFSASLPVFTTFNKAHGPEIDYLRSGYNGLICHADIKIYTDLVISALSDLRSLEEMQKNALETSREYSVENMVDCFVKGIQSFYSSRNQK